MSCHAALRPAHVMWHEGKRPNPVARHPVPATEWQATGRDAMPRASGAQACDAVQSSKLASQLQLAQLHCTPNLLAVMNSSATGCTALRREPLLAERRTLLFLPACMDCRCSAA